MHPPPHRATSEASTWGLGSKRGFWPHAARFPAESPVSIQKGFQDPAENATGRWGAWRGAASNPLTAHGGSLHSAAPLRAPALSEKFKQRMTALRVQSARWSYREHGIASRRAPRPGAE